MEENRLKRRTRERDGCIPSDDNKTFVEASNLGKLLPVLSDTLISGPRIWLEPIAVITYATAFTFSQCVCYSADTSDMHQCGLLWSPYVIGQTIIFLL